MSTPLSSRDVFPAGHSEISQRRVALATGVTVRIAARGPISARPVVMLPGWGASLYSFRHAFDLLTPHGLRVIAADLRGHGFSDKPTSRGSYSLDAYCADLDALLDALEISRAMLVGQSMGGAIAMHYALRRPERVPAMVMINPADLVPLPFLPAVRATPRALLSAIGERLVPRFMVGMILRRIAYGNPALVTERDVDEYWATTQEPGFVNAMRALLSEFDWRPLSDEDAARLAVPSVVMLGASDRLIHNTTRSAQRLNGTTVRVLEGGHCVHEERPHDAYQIIAEFADTARF